MLRNLKSLRLTMNMRGIEIGVDFAHIWNDHLSVSYSRLVSSDSQSSLWHSKCLRNRRDFLIKHAMLTTLDFSVVKQEY